MLKLTVLSIAAACAFWLIVLWLSVEPLANLVTLLLSQWGFDVGLGDSGFVLFGLIKAFVVPMMVFSFLWPIVASSAVLLAGLYVTPPVVNWLSKRPEFADLECKGNSSMWLGLMVTLKAVAIFMVGWIVTLPLWLIPGMGFVLSLGWTAYLLIEVMRFDALAAHATREEMKLLRRQDQTGVWIVGVVCAFLSLIPPILLLMPVMSALAMTRHYLALLKKIRRGTAQQDQVIDL